MWRTNKKSLKLELSLLESANKRKKQADKHTIARQYEPGDLVWIRKHSLSDANQKRIQKLCLLYSGLFQIIEILRKNAYLVGNRDGNIIGAFNSRMLRP